MYSFSFFLFSFFSEQVNRSNKQGSLTRLLVLDAYTLTSLCIPFSAKILGFWLKTLILVKILVSTVFCLFSLLPRLPLMLYANPTSYSRLQTQGFTETLSLAEALISYLICSNELWFNNLSNVLVNYNSKLILVLVSWLIIDVCVCIYIYLCMYIHI